jgi:ELM2 domain
LRCHAAQKKFKKKICRLHSSSKRKKNEEKQDQKKKGNEKKRGTTCFEHLYSIMEHVLSLAMSESPAPLPQLLIMADAMMAASHSVNNNSSESAPVVVEDQPQDEQTDQEEQEKEQENGMVDDGNDDNDDNDDGEHKKSEQSDASLSAAPGESSSEETIEDGDDDDDDDNTSLSALAQLMSMASGDDDDDDDPEFDDNQVSLAQLMSGEVDDDDDEEDNDFDSGYETDESDRDQALHEYKPPRIGAEFQAQIPNVMQEKMQRVRRTLHRYYDNDERQGQVVWVPTFLRDSAVSAFLDKAEQSVATLSTATERRAMSQERALELLHHCKYNRRVATSSVANDPSLAVELVDALDPSERELVRYFLVDVMRANAIRHTAADWCDCARNYVKTKSTAAIREYYYRWKGTPNYQAFVDMVREVVSERWVPPPDGYRVPPQRALHVDPTIDWSLVADSVGKEPQRRANKRPRSSGNRSRAMLTPASSVPSSSSSASSASSSAYDSEDEFSSSPSSKRQRSHRRNNSNSNSGRRAEQEQDVYNKRVIFHHVPQRRIESSQGLHCQVVARPPEPSLEQLYVDMTDSFLQQVASLQ